MKLKNIKDSFNEREIQPGADSWQKLSAQLDAADKNKKRPYLYWLGAVAAIIIVALMVYPAINRVDMVETSPDSQLVIDESSTNSKTDKKDDNSPQIEVAVEVNLNSELREQENSIEKERETAPAVKKTPVTPQVKQALAQARSFKRNPVKVNTSTTVSKPLLDDPKPLNKVEAIDMTANATVENKQPLTADQEAALLLKGLLENSSNGTSVATHSIKPEQLLRETEWDVEADRRNRLNKELKDGLGRLKNEAFALIGVNN